MYMIFFLRCWSVQKAVPEAPTNGSEEFSQGLFLGFRWVIQALEDLAACLPLPRVPTLAFPLYLSFLSYFLFLHFLSVH